MPSQASPHGRRERNKQDKLDRITAAARTIFATRSIDDVTTAEIATAAGVAEGTLFLYAQSKGALLLLAQNAGYAAALAEGRAAAARTAVAEDAIMAILRPIVACNRSQIDNGRAYLREMVFGDPTQAHHAEAIALTLETETAMAEALTCTTPGMSPARAGTVAHVMSAVLLLEMGAGVNTSRSLNAVEESIRAQLRTMLA